MTVWGNLLMTYRRLKPNENEYFTALAQKCHICYIGGAYVKKTALVIRLAQDLSKAGYRLSANIKVKEACNLDKIFALDTPGQCYVILESA